MADTSTKNAEKTFTEAQVDAKVAEATKDLFTQDQVDAKVAEATKDLFTQDQVDAKVAEATKDLFTQDQVDAKVADATSSLFTQEQMDEKIKAAVAKVKADAPKAVRKRKPREFKISTAKSAPTIANDIVGKGGQICFADPDGTEMTDLQPLEFRGGDFAFNEKAGTVILKPKIDFPITAKAAEIQFVWLLTNSGKPVEYTRMIHPMGIGEGRAAQIPENSLRFG